MLFEVAQSLDGVGWVLIVELVLDSTEAADGPLSEAFLVIYLKQSYFFYFAPNLKKSKNTMLYRWPNLANFSLSKHSKPLYRWKAENLIFLTPLKAFDLNLNLYDIL